jgi:Domain of unknown function (DUF397)
MAQERGHTSLTWRTPLSCNGGACVKVAASELEVFIADSKAPDGPVLSYSHTEWQEFVSSIKKGYLDDLIK